MRVLEEAFGQKATRDGNNLFISDNGGGDVEVIWLRQTPGDLSEVSLKAFELESYGLNLYGVENRTCITARACVRTLLLKGLGVQTFLGPEQLAVVSCRRPRGAVCIRTLPGPKKDPGRQREEVLAQTAHLNGEYRSIDESR